MYLYSVEDDESISYNVKRFEHLRKCFINPVPYVYYKLILFNPLNVRSLSTRDTFSVNAVVMFDVQYMNWLVIHVGAIVL